MITVRANGKEYSGFTSVSYQKSVDQLCAQFSISCTSDDNIAFPLPRGTAIELFIDGTKVLTGDVEQISGNGSHDDSSVTIQGRDKTRLVLKNDLPPKFSVKGPISLKAVIEKSLKECGINLRVIDESSGIDNFSSKEILTADVGADLWSFWLSLSEKRQVLITSDWDSNIVIINPGQTKYNKKIEHRFDDNGRNNVLSYEFAFDDSNRRSEYHVRSIDNFSVRRNEPPPSENALWTQPPDDKVSSESLTSIDAGISASSPGGEVERVLSWQGASLETAAKNITSKRTRRVGVAYDSAINDGSVSYEKAERSSDSKECERIARWRANEAMVDSISYSCDIPGHTADYKPYNAGYMMDVVSEPAGINSQMLIRSINMIMSKSGEDAEELTTIGFTTPNAYSIGDKSDNSQYDSGVIGENWNDGDFK